VHRGKLIVAYTPGLEECILEDVAGDSRISMRQLAAAFAVGHMTVLRILHEQPLYPYHLEFVHCLIPADQPPQENDCRWFVQPTATPLLVSSVFFIDEATFVRDGITYFHSQHQ
jgi:hypothetical protein